jgi:hypothetical protein
MIAHPCVRYWCYGSVKLMPNDARLTLRLSEPLAAALRQRAAEDHRSLNSQIVFLLEQALYPTADADAFRDSRRSLGSMPRSTAPQPFTRRRGGNR